MVRQMGSPTAWLLAAALLPCGVGVAVAREVKGTPNPWPEAMGTREACNDPRGILFY